MSLILNDKQAGMLRISQQLRELAEWLEAERAALPSLPVDAWRSRLDAHIDAWDACLSEHDLLPKGADAEREPLRRAIDRAASALSGADPEAELGARLAARLDELAVDLEALRPALGTEGMHEELDAILSDFAQWRSKLHGHADDVRA